MRIPKQWLLISCLSLLAVGWPQSYGAEVAARPASVPDGLYILRLRLWHQGKERLKTGLTVARTDAGKVVFSAWWSDRIPPVIGTLEGDRFSGSIESERFDLRGWVTEGSRGQGWRLDGTLIVRPRPGQARSPMTGTFSIVPVPGSLREAGQQWTPPDQEEVMRLLREMAATGDEEQRGLASLFLPKEERPADQGPGVAPSGGDLATPGEDSRPSPPAAEQPTESPATVAEQPTESPATVAEQPTESPATAAAVPVTIVYESWTQKVAIEGTHLVHLRHEYQYDNPVSGTPSGRTTTTLEGLVEPAAVERLLALADEVGFFSLEDAYGGQEDQRYYPYAIEIRHGSRQKSVLYRSRPDVPDRPEAFVRLETAILDVAAVATAGH